MVVIASRPKGRRGDPGKGMGSESISGLLLPLGGIAMTVISLWSICLKEMDGLSVYRMTP